MVALAARKKLDALWADLLAGGTDVAAKLLADRVVATWLQVTYADSRYALATNTSPQVLDFLAKRQKHAQQQHFSALNAWRMWRRAAAYMLAEVTAQTIPLLAEGPKEISGPTANDVRPEWIVPFPDGGGASQAIGSTSALATCFIGYCRLIRVK